MPRPTSDPVVGALDEVGIAEALAVARRSIRSTPRTRWQLESVLRDKGIDAVTAARVLDLLERTGEVDDHLFAILWVDSRHERRGLASARLRRELESRGVAEHHIDEALARIATPPDGQSLMPLVDRLARKVSNAAPVVAERRLIGMLLRRGHDADAVHAAVTAWRDRVEEA